ncbi:MAG: sulfotransferase [Steroidobacteraceae bacterium]
MNPENNSKRAPVIKRYLIILGAMKCGTSSLFRYLAQHPAICAASDKESGFFAVDYRWPLGLDYYEGLFDWNPAQHVWALDASTEYTKRPYVLDVPANMKSLPGVEYRFIYIMRNPLRRIESHARHFATAGREFGLYNPETRYTGLDDGITEMAFNTSRYAYQLAPFVEAFGRRRIHLVTLEELSQDPQSVMRNVLAFAGLDPITIDSARWNGADTQRVSPPFWRAASRLPALRALWRSLVPQRARSALWSRMAVDSGRFKLTPDEQLRLIAALRDELATLEDVYGIDVRGLWGLDYPREAASLAAEPIELRPSEIRMEQAA